jgi:hypothetical protein
MPDQPNLTFFPWLRRGLGIFVEEPETGHRAVVPVELAIEEEPARPMVNPTAEVEIDVIGPGDIAGFDTRVITRVWPKPDVSDVETHLFPLVEFSEPDLPWRYTPRPPDVEDDIEEDVLPPWLVLIALTDDEWKAVKPATTAEATALPAIEILDPAACLPSLENSFAWAHIQVSGNTTKDGLENVLKNERHRVLSRLLCPRRLKPNQPHTAFLVPAFASGVAAGLGKPLTGIHATDPAWYDNPYEGEQLILPVYHQWRFHTGDRGSFRELAGRLVPRVLSAAAHRQMDITDPGFGIEPPNPGRASVPVPGALRPAGVELPDWPTADRDEFAAEIHPLLNAPATGLGATPTDPVVLAPPLYGEWHAGTHQVQTSGTPPWFHELNTAPHMRVVAAVGTQIVQKEQQALMASAWNQAEGLRNANQQLREAQLGREGSQRLYDRHIKTIPRFEQLFQLAERVLGRVMDQSPSGGSPGQTVRGTFEKSPIPIDIFGGAWRRICGVRGPVGRRQGRTGELPPPGGTLPERTNEPGGPSPSPTPPTGSGVPTPGRAGAGLAPGCLTPERLDALEQVPQVDLLYWALVFFFVGRSMAAGGSPFGISRALLRLALSLVQAGATVNGLAKLRDQVAAGTGTTPPGAPTAAPTVENFNPEEPLPENAPSIPPPPLPPPGATDNEPLQRFRPAAEILLQELARAPGPGRQEFEVDLADLASKVLAGLDPRSNINPVGRGRFSISDELWFPADPLEPVMVTPVFPQPMYEALREVSLEWVLPGLASIPADTVSLLATNQPFIEAFMAGLNHEMSRELLWNEYPTDQRGTYFRQFWDFRGFIPKAGETPTPDEDIADMSEWTDSLGKNRARNSEEKLVLFLRGELVRRYPHMAVYVAKAELEGGQRVPGEDHEYPRFSGNLGSDVGLYGFLSSEEQIKEDHGAYFVLQEPPHDTQFTWERRPSGIPEPLPGQHVVVDVDSADVASGSLSRPQRVAIYVTAMLPPAPPSP